MRRRSEGEPTGDVGMPARRIERSFVSAGDEGEPGLTGRCSGAGAAVLKMEASALLLMPAARVDRLSRSSKADTSIS